MNKIIGFSGLLLGALVLSGCSLSSQDSESEALQSVLDQVQDVSVPVRPAEINGYISSVEGNKIVIQNEIGKEVLSEEEQAAKKAERQQMTQEERQALRAQELEGVETEELTLILPVGTPVFKGDGTGATVKAEMSEIAKGSYVSIWKNGDVIDAVKIKGVN